MHLYIYGLKCIQLRKKSEKKTHRINFSSSRRSKMAVCIPQLRMLGEWPLPSDLTETSDFSGATFAVVSL